MASKNNSQAHQSEDRVNKILETLPELEKLLSSLKSTSDKEESSTAEGNHETEPLARSQSAPPALTHVPFDGQLIKELQDHFRFLKLKLGKLDQFQTNMGVELDKHLVALQSLITNLYSSRLSPQTQPDLEDIKKISDLLYQVPLLSAKSENQKAAAYGGDEVDQYKVASDIDTYVKNLIKSEAFRQVKHKFMELEIEKKICLLSFAVFPENRAVHRTVLMYWWIGEGIIPIDGAEEAVRDVLKEFTEKNLVEPVEERRKVAPSSYKMTPFVHSSVIHLSKEIGLFDIYGGKDNKPKTSMSEMGKVCLVEVSTEAAPVKKPARDIETVFNVHEIYLDSIIKCYLKNPHANRIFTIKSSEAWFKSLNVLYLGRWERSQKRHIEVQNHELMKCLKHLTKVKLLSFQGISTIRSLSSSVCKLRELIILDLRECYELTELPEKIDSLENLVYLDMSGCYMLEWVPLRLALLKKLEVLKGFVVSDDLNETVACKLSYLKKLKKLRKLSVEINREDLSMRELWWDIEDLKMLRSLKVTWRRDFVYYYTPTNITGKIFVRTLTRIGSPEPVRDPPRLPHALENLRIERFPYAELPPWLRPTDKLQLKKLHIGGGIDLKGFSELWDREEPSKCSVEVLRLRSLPNLKVEWRQLKLYFPKLTFLEKIDCPRVTLTPCDGHGIWRADQDS